MKKTAFNLFVNLGLLVSGIMMIFSGLVLQIKYHMGHHSNSDSNIYFLNIDYLGWSDIHKLSIIIVSIFILFHVSKHWKWYKVIIKKRLLRENRLITLLTIAFCIVTITGYISWIINSVSSNEVLREDFIEIHDKFALVLTVLLIIHLFKRTKWYFIAFNKLKTAKKF